MKKNFPFLLVVFAIVMSGVEGVLSPIGLAYLVVVLLYLVGVVQHSYTSCGTGDYAIRPGIVFSDTPGSLFATGHIPGPILNFFFCPILNFNFIIMSQVGFLSNNI